MSPFFLFSVLHSLGREILAPDLPFYVVHSGSGKFSTFASVLRTMKVLKFLISLGNRIAARGDARARSARSEYLKAARVRGARDCCSERGQRGRPAAVSESLIPSYGEAAAVF